jgi:hypothetical protein
MQVPEIAAWPAATDVTLGDWETRSFDLRRGSAVVVACVAGSVLVTLEGDPVDHVLSAGDALTARRRGRVVVAGLGPSAVRLQAIARRPGVTAPASAA